MSKTGKELMLFEGTGLLIDMPPCLSPRLRWMRMHKIKTRRVNGRWEAGWNFRPGFCCSGEIEEDALLDFAFNQHIPNWRMIG